MPALRGAPPFAVLYLDIDDFKDVNDTLGHAMGDLLLKEVVERLKVAVGPNDLVARFGGDKFAILATGVAHPNAVGELAARIRKLLGEPFRIGGHKLRITSSIGIALYSPETAGPEDMMVQADLALYGAKDEGRNCYRFHSQDLDRRVHDAAAQEHAGKPAPARHQDRHRRFRYRLLFAQISHHLPCEPAEARAGIRVPGDGRLSQRCRGARLHPARA